MRRQKIIYDTHWELEIEPGIIELKSDKLTQDTQQKHIHSFDVV